MAPVAQTLGETTGSVSALQQLKTWIEDCNANHPRCKPVSATGNDDQETGDNPTSTGSSRDPAPRRLIKVGRDDEKPYVVDLTEPPYYGKVPRYSTLSWCWGDSTMKMKTEDVPQFMDPAHGIPDLSVQKTFKHAIDVTRSLGIGYIWIDALCIIQEGPDADFHAEGVKMDRCYRNSAVTIAAAASTSGSGGLFYPVNGRMRDLSDLIPNTFTTSEHCKLPSAGPWSVLAADMWEDQLLRSSHLYTRGWVVQERMLSPRLIHFAAEQLFWDCQTVTACEAFPSGLPALLDLEAATCRDWRWRLQHRSKLPVQDEDHSHETLWHAAISHYSSCSLTHHSDKFRAIWGIARVLQDLQGEKYHGGLWAEKMQDQLAWRVEHPRRTSRPHLKKRIPSWSWASVDGKVTLNSRLPQLDEPWFKTATDHAGGHIIPQLEEIVDEEQPRIVKGKLAIRSSLVEMRFSCSPEGVWKADVDQEAFGEGRFHVFPDSEHPFESANAIAGVLPKDDAYNKPHIFTEGHLYFALLLAGGKSSTQSLSRRSTGLEVCGHVNNHDNTRWQGFGMILHELKPRVFERVGVFRFRNLETPEWEKLSTTWCPTQTELQQEHKTGQDVNIWIE